MSNKEFFKSMEYQFYNLNTSRPMALHFGSLQPDLSQRCKVFSEGTHLFDLFVQLHKRKISSEISYHNFLDCLHSPYELQRWCCGLFRGQSNYFAFISQLERDLDYVVKAHSGLFLPY